MVVRVWRYSKLLLEVGVVVIDALNYINGYKSSTFVVNFSAISIFIRVTFPSSYRTMSSANTISNGVPPAADPYRLNRDVAASTRLSLQHYIWKENMGYILHPSIDVSRPDLSIADVGTGTG